MATSESADSLHNQSNDGYGIQQIQLQREGGEALEEACDRTPGVQQKDGPETYAILQSLLRTHTTVNTELYCDDQGCVNNWDRAMGTQVNRKARQKYAAILTRIEGLVQERAMRGSNTSMHWIQSYVQGENKRKSTGSKVICACTNRMLGDISEMPGNPSAPREHVHSHRCKRAHAEAR